jgi:hypothetical protein
MVVAIISYPVESFATVNMLFVMAYIFYGLKIHRMTNIIILAPACSKEVYGDGIYKNLKTYIHIQQQFAKHVIMYNHCCQDEYDSKVNLGGEC